MPGKGFTVHLTKKSDQPIGFSFFVVEPQA